MTGNLSRTVSQVEVFVLGPLEARIDGRPVDLGSPKQRAVLGMLAVEPNRPVSVDRLVDQLWGEDPPSSALGSLHAYVSNLRRALEPGRAPRAPSSVLVSRAPGYMLAVGAGQLDMLRFEELATQGAAALAAGRAEQAAAALREALALWRGPALADFAYETFVGSVAVRLEELRRTAAEDLVDARLALGQHAAVIGTLEDLVGSDPLRERPWAQLMVALYRSGRQTEALRAYERVRTVLTEQLGLSPGPELRRLEQAVLAQDPGLDTPAVAPVEAATSRPAERTRARTPALLAPVGRDAQLALLDDAVARLAEGGGTVVVLTGEPGAGKSTLLDALAERAEAAGSRVGKGQAHEGALAPPLWPWAEVFRQLDLGGPPTPDAAQERSAPAVLDQAMGQLRALASLGPVTVVLDDLQWADELTHQLLRLALGASGLPLILAVGLREPVQDPSPDLLATRESLARLPGLVRISLPGLDRRAVVELVERITGGVPAPEVAETIYDRTAGNPFFVTELARLLASEHALGDPGRMARAGIPIGARDVVRQRLSRLPDQAVVVLGVAAVIGPQVDVRLLGRITGIGTEELLDVLDLTVASGLLVERAGGRGTYEFTHDIVREAIYEALPGMRRALVHEQAVNGLLELHGQALAAAHEVAHHALRAVAVAGADQAVPLLLASSRAAQRQLAIDLAERQLRSALELLDGVEATPVRRVVRADIEARLGAIVFYVHGRRADAERHLERALQLSAGDPRARLAALLGNATLLMLWGEVEATTAAADEAMAIARSLGDGHAESDTLYWRAAIAAWTGDPDAARGDIDLAVKIAEDLSPAGRPSRPHVPLACKRGFRALLRALSGEKGDALAEGRAAMALAREDGAESWTLSWTGSFALLAAAFSEDRPELERLSEEIGDRASGLDYADSVIGACRAWAGVGRPGGTPDTAALAGARRQLAAAGDGFFCAPVALLEAGALLGAGRNEEARALLDVTRREAARAGHRLWVARIDRMSVRG